MHVYKMNDYDFVATTISNKMKVNNWYSAEIGKENDIRDVTECDLDSNGMFYEVASDQYKYKRLYPIEEVRGTQPTGKYVIFQGGEVYQHISFREAGKREDWANDPFIIANTEE